MQVKIDGKDYELNFGIRFINLMDQNHNLSNNGIKTGMGVNQAVTSLTMLDPIGLAEIIECTTWINKERPTMNQIYNFLDTTADIAKLCKDILKELQTSNSTKAQVKNVLKTMKNAQERAMKMSLEKSV